MDCVMDKTGVSRKRLTGTMVAAATHGGPRAAITGVRGRQLKQYVRLKRPAKNGPCLFCVEKAVRVSGSDDES